MTDPVDTWVGCLVLVVAPTPLAGQVSEAVLRAEQMIFNDPVYVDATRVLMSSVDDLLRGDLDTIAFTLHQELVRWGASAARNPAPSATFCVLMVHSDPRESDRLVNALANTSRLGELPILFRTAAVDAADADRSEELVLTIFDAINATAHEVDKTPEFSLDVHRLSRMIVDTPAALDRLLPNEEQPLLDGSTTTERVEKEVDREPEPQPPDEESPKADKAKFTLTSLVPNVVLDRSRELVARRKLPSTGVDVIKGLSRRTDRVLLLYVVFASEPVKPPRPNRRARADFAYALTRTLLSTDHDAGREPWYVRTFSAGRSLIPGRPIPVPELLRHRDFPDRWGEHFDLFDTADDLREVIERDWSSFRRRGVTPVKTTVVFIAESIPHVVEDTKTRLAALCSVGTVAWIYFTRGNAADDDKEEFESNGTYVLQHHDDLVDELLQLVEPSSPGDEGNELTVSPSVLGEG
jgi:hypothetical protein